ncbi:hypothetical protein JCM3775_001140, partial [Rhodotorula graminis]
MTASSQRPPPPPPPPALADLRSKAHDTLASLQPAQFSVRAWSRAAQTAFDHADQAWRRGRTNNDHHQVASAFLEYKRAAGILQIIMKHPQYKDVVAARSDDYFAVARLKELVTGAKASQDQVVAWLEQREATMPDPSTATKADSNHLIGPRADASSSRPSPHKTPSFPTATLADRLAKLRASGMPD